MVIHDYDPHWPEQFEALRLRIGALLGSLAAAIEHVGSTAVPGLAAKPIIDLDVILAAATDFPLVVAKLATIGYEHEGDLGITGREAFRALPVAVPHHLYVCPPGNTAYREHILFRDYLRTHPQDARAYGELKRRLAAKFSGDRDGYTLAKTDFIRGILRQS